MITCGEEFFLKILPISLLVISVVLLVRFSNYYDKIFPIETEELKASIKVHWANGALGFVWMIFTLLLWAFFCMNTDAFYYEENMSALLVEANNFTETGLMVTILFLSFGFSYVIFDLFYFKIFGHDSYLGYGYKIFLNTLRVYVSIIFIPLFILAVYLFYNNRTEFHNEKLKTRNYIFFDKEKTIFYKDLLKISFSSVYEEKKGRHTTIEQGVNIWELILPNSKRYVLVEPEEKLLTTILKHSQLKIDTVDIIYNKNDCE